MFSNGPKSRPKNPPGCSILCSCVLENFMLVEELLESLKTCVLVNNNLCGKLFSSFDERYCNRIFYSRF